MSEPKRGMVAGQGITTQAQTKEFDEGYERIFGRDRKPCRGRFVVRDGKTVDVAEDWTDAETRAQTVTEELVYSNLGKTTDGVDVSSRKKHREYLKRNGFALAGDFSQDYQQKEAARRERHEDRERREIVERNVYKIFGG